MHNLDNILKPELINMREVQRNVKDDKKLLKDKGIE